MRLLENAISLSFPFLICNLQLGMVPVGDVAISSELKPPLYREGKGAYKKVTIISQIINLRSVSVNQSLG